MNIVILSGNTGKDPDLRYSTSGTAVCKFSLATKNYNKETVWHNIVAFQKRAETIAEYVKKGDKITVVGEISYGEYEKDGQKIKTTDIIVNQFEFGSNQKRSESPSTGNQSDYWYPGTPDDDVPF